MFLENIVFDAVDPRREGRSWETALGCEQLTDEPEGYETRYAVEDGPVLDLCFQRVPEPPTATSRLYLDVTDGTLAAISLESADPGRDAEFWSWLSGWVSATPHTLHHPSQLGPRLVLRPEEAPKSAGKNPVHLDVRLETGDDPDEVEAAIVERGGRRDHHPEWGELPWRSYTDPSGNEFCVLRAPS